MGFLDKNFGGYVGYSDNSDFGNIGIYNLNTGSGLKSENLWHSKIVTSNLLQYLDASKRDSFNRNVFPYPTDVFAFAGGVPYNCTLIRDTIQSPVGKSPMKMTITVSTDPMAQTYNNSTWNLHPAVAGETWTFSFWAKADRDTYVQPFLMEANSSGAYLTSSNAVYPITTQWQRFSITRTFDNASTAFCQIRLDAYDTAVVGTILWWDGIQVEREKSPTPFIHGMKNVWYDLSGNNFNGYINNIIKFDNNNIKSFKFTDANAYSYIISNIPSTSKTNTTIQCWAYHDGGGGTFLQVGNMYAIGTGNPYHENAGSLLSGLFQNIRWIDTGVTVSIGWHMFTMTMDASSTPAFYLDTTYIGAFAGTGPQNLSWNYLHIGTDGAAASVRGISGNIGAVLFYSKVLSSTEVTQNFNALRSFYGV